MIQEPKSVAYKAFSIPPHATAKIETYEFSLEGTDIKVVGTREKETNQEAPMTAEEIIKSKLNVNIIVANSPDYTFNKIVEAMEAYKDSHTAPLQSEIDRLKKEVEQLEEKLKNNASFF